LQAGGNDVELGDQPGFLAPAPAGGKAGGVKVKHGLKDAKFVAQDGP
jgi:hypothetical protein